MSELVSTLEQLASGQRKFLNKGGLCVGLVITKTAQERGLPIAPESLRTEEGGQVAGLGKAAVQNILADYGITKVLAEEGGRTSRGSLGLMESYVKTLNELHAKLRDIDLDIAMNWWIEKVKLYLASEGPKFNFDTSKSVAANLADIFVQAMEIQKNSGGANFVGAMLQHMVGAKLDIVLGQGAVSHHGFSVADHSTDRAADFQVNEVAIHVTTHPSEALIRKAAANLRTGLKPLIVTLADGVEGAAYLLKNTEWKDRIDVIDAAQFLTANVYERSLFKAVECKTTLVSILTRYNEIVAECETDPVLRIRL
ncbi:DUF4928 family protein [Prosthecobacter vanneervenii]|uniref:DUF4928 domain-containing protein n=1 Tax=Prosthecobacter vanneervenii TaxID=48466 RepID=A0A7W7Y8D2_9BACT|nr:DUF4928 family protein [Prosthecobacter vanneervenii]MBB5031345.1 hypothetical protein [Prosthecobacter vanneervenii]